MITVEIFRSEQFSILQKCEIIWLWKWNYFKGKFTYFIVFEWSSVKVFKTELSIMILVLNLPVEAVTCFQVYLFIPNLTVFRQTVTLYFTLPFHKKILTLQHFMSRELCNWRIFERLLSSYIAQSVKASRS